MAYGDGNELCPVGEELWLKHSTFKLSDLDSKKGAYKDYVYHIWTCEECQIGLDLSKETIAVQKRAYGVK